MILILKILLVLICALIAFQDFKERMVSWILFPAMGIVLAFLYIKQVSFNQFYPFVLSNFVLVSIIILLLYGYTKYIAKREFINVSFGLGDLLFFYALALGFPTLTFMVIFTVSMLFALVTFLIVNRKQEMQTVPLAGLMGLCLTCVIVASFFPFVPSLYTF